MEDRDSTRVFDGHLLYYGFDLAAESVADLWYDQPCTGCRDEIEEFLLLCETHDLVSLDHCQCRFCQNFQYVMEVWDDPILELSYTLETVGKPLNLADITGVHNDLFPDNPIAETDVHILLAGGAKGIVSIRQAREELFALRVWGYRQHTSRLNELVEGIVVRIFEKTHRPVACDVIVSELGSVGYVSTGSDLRRAIKANPLIVNLGGATFVPRLPEEEPSNHDEIEELLAQFTEDLSSFGVM